MNLLVEVFAEFSVTSKHIVGDMFGKESPDLV
jgi:hypothetical protein